MQGSLSCRQNEQKRQFFLELSSVKLFSKGLQQKNCRHQLDSNWNRWIQSNTLTARPTCFDKVNQTRQTSHKQSFKKLDNMIYRNKREEINEFGNFPSEYAKLGNGQAVDVGGHKV